MTTQPTTQSPLAAALSKLVASEDTFMMLHDADRDRAELAVAESAPFIVENAYDGCLEEAESFIRAQNNKVFGAFSYDLKNQIEKLNTRHGKLTGFPDLLLFATKKIISYNEKCFPPAIDVQVTNATLPLALKPRIRRDRYLKDIAALKTHIQQGDIYEINYCQEFYSENQHIDPLAVYQKLQGLTSAPFSALLHHNGAYLLCASPERFLRRTGTQLTSQPIKGTIKRGSTPAEDEALKKQLRDDPKERGENIMITDLVRNDLTRAGVPGSTEVDELCGIYSFKTVHQMISTVHTSLHPGTGFGHIFRSTFPMGSMTGAPKVRAMELIEQYEHFSRELYAGSIGYFDVNGDFDMNVVIRSIFWNSHTGYLSIRVGGAITALSDPESEYGECMLKAKALFEALQP